MSSMLLERLDAARNAYLAFYRDEIRRAQGDPRYSDVVVELQLAVGDGSNQHGSRFNLPLRMDVACRENGEIRLIAAAAERFGEWLPFVVENRRGATLAATASIAPFCWEDCVFAAEGGSDDWQPVLDWWRRWYDPDDIRPLDEDGLAGVVHFMSEPVQTEEGIVFSVDFGSAPAEAFMDLLTTLHSMGMRNIRVGRQNETSSSSGSSGWRV